MKRALAERAKQSVRREVKAKIDPVAVSTSSTSGGGGGAVSTAPSRNITALKTGANVTATDLNSTTSPPSPGKIPRATSSNRQPPSVPSVNVRSESTSRKGRDKGGDEHAESPPTTVSSSSAAPIALSSSNSRSNTNAVSSSSSSRAGQKRQRNTGVVEVALRHVPDDASAFYLQHQNRALAVEWQSLNSQVKLLTQERDERRQDCWAATQALHSLQATWTQLEAVVLTSGQVASTSPTAGAAAAEDGSLSHAVVGGVFPSTGSGESVEWTRALSDALEVLAVGNSSGGANNSARPGKDSAKNSAGDVPDSLLSSSTAPGQEPMVGKGGVLRSDWSSQCAANLAARAAVLQEHLLPRLTSSSASAARLNQQDEDSFSSLQETARLRQQLQETKATYKILERQVAELAHSRDAAVQSERKVRRNVYRLSVGMMTAEQVVQAMEKDASEEDEEFKELLRQQQQQLASKMQIEGGNSGIFDGTTDKGGRDDTDATASSDAVDSKIQALQGRIRDLEQAVSSRDEELQKLDSMIKDKEKRITDLSLKQRSEEDDQKLEKYEVVSKQLESTKETITQLESQLETSNSRWTTARSNEETALQTLREQQTKFERRWVELSEALASFGGGGGTNISEAERGVDATAPDSSKGEKEDREPTAANSENDEGVDGNESRICSKLLEPPMVRLSTEITLLQHKLAQALENVRQAESTRRELKEALAMNESLQAKLDEFKSKYASLRNAASSSSNNSVGPSGASSTRQQSSDANASTINNNNTGGSNTAAATSSSSSSSEKYEKLHREHRRLRKEMSAVVASKEAAKAKLERAEKERDTLIEGNTRLLKQITEKDDMNAKSLSTILHLKSMTEQLTLERDNLEQQAKSASQLALAARLASNAKERVSEEVMKEKESLEKHASELESKLRKTKSQLDKITTEWSEASAKTTILNVELSSALKRTEELVSELHKKNSEIRKLTDAITTAEREAREANERLQKLSKQAGGGSAAGESVFTVDQLNTQISVLKNRLACPVCHYRDKECIIMRCRHMHCKQCVEERITNRSRKCPTCNNRFSDKDVEDIWLSG